MSKPNLWAVIPAAGVGRRMGGDLPKQYLTLAGHKVIDHAIGRLLLHPAISGLYVALAEHDEWWSSTQHVDHPGLVRVRGGEERSHSVLNALKELSQRVSGNDWVLVHDAARPCVQRMDIDRLIAAVRDHPVGGVLGIPVHDTMKRTNDEGEIQETVERDRLWRAFTPQMFRLGALATALEGALDAGIPVTDEASAIEWAGERPLMVEGAADNIKITRPGDLEIATFYIQRQEGCS